uniref:Uncharacterized protein n=1 Tax=Solanum lycopersicum TaxID=4081 RepID=A0A3Q7FM71_SOLLC
RLPLLLSSPSPHILFLSFSPSSRSNRGQQQLVQDGIAAPTTPTPSEPPTGKNSATATPRSEQSSSR